MGDKKNNSINIRRVFRLGDRILVTVNGITDTGVFIALNGNQLIWVRHDESLNEVRLVYSPFDAISIERL